MGGRLVNRLTSPSTRHTTTWVAVIDWNAVVVVSVPDSLL